MMTGGAGVEDLSFVEENTFVISICKQKFIYI